MSNDEKKEFVDFMSKISLLHKYIKELKGKTERLHELKLELPNVYAEKEKGNFNF